MVGVYIREFDTFAAVYKDYSPAWGVYPPVCCGIKFFGEERQKAILVNQRSI